MSTRQHPGIAERQIDAQTYTGSTPVRELLAGRTFADPRDLARYIGRHYGWRSGNPTHGGPRYDGVAWWVHETMLHIYRDTVAASLVGPEHPAAGDLSYFRLVEGMESITEGEHAEYVAVALEAAGLVVVPVEAMQ